jgi:hypothetical protein
MAKAKELLETEEARDAPPIEADEKQAPAPAKELDEIDALMADNELSDEDFLEDNELERLSRNQDTYDSDDMHEEYPDDFEPPELLDAPPPREGFAQRWVSTHIGGKPDIRNMARKANEKWRPRNVDTVPKGVHAPTIKHGQFDGYIGVEGMVLMERPMAIHKAYARKNRRKITNLEEAVDNNLLNVHQQGVGLGQPTMSNSSRVTRGRRPEPAPD